MIKSNRIGIFAGLAASALLIAPFIATSAVNHQVTEPQAPVSQVDTYKCPTAEDLKYQTQGNRFSVIHNADGTTTVKAYAYPSEADVTNGCVPEGTKTYFRPGGDTTWTYPVGQTVQFTEQH